ncbi:hypothetical protein [Falsarthrobacter nasiphocae]|uniref:DUF2269 family protein n=1 Tax=Falsarthrobacter nasiphocae TaxID=189863 RepID=A0AAE4C681_9MICC|nr:hypothetical protein [Falsarthrobacter nasiphocae]MDR6891847.1 hypothetical protein [Falsarthrobacter nasiphocae]
MEKVYLFIHILAAILTFGPLAVSTSMFPRLARDASDKAASTMARISRFYGFAALLVPVMGLMIPFVGGGPGLKMWHIESLVMTLVALGILLFWVVPMQRKTLVTPANERKSLFGKLHMSAGIFNIVWLFVLVRMVWH